MEWLGETAMLMLVPIALASVVGLALFVARWRAHRAERVIPEELRADVLDSIDERDWKQARRGSEEDDSALGRVFAEGLRFRGASRREIRAAMEDVGRREMNRLERYVGAIGALASVTPLMGLLGTVLGMISVFQELVDEAGAEGVVDPTALAGGIWVALVTTAAGLAVAIPLYLGYRYLLGRLDALAVELEEAAAQLLDRLAPPPVAAGATDVDRGGGDDEIRDGEEGDDSDGPELRAAGGS